SLKLWDLRERRLVRVMDKGVIYPYLALSADKRHGLFGSWNFNGERGEIVLRDLVASRVLHAFRGSEGWSVPFAFSPNLKYAVLAKRKDKERAPSKLVVVD